MKGQKSRLSYSDQKVFLFRAQYIGFLRHVPAPKKYIFSEEFMHILLASSVIFC